MLSVERSFEYEVLNGTVVRAEPLSVARWPRTNCGPASGDAIGEKASPAKVDRNRAEELISSQVVAGVNFPPRQIAH